MLELLGYPEQVGVLPAHKAALPYSRYYSRYYTTAGTVLVAL